MLSTTTAVSLLPSHPFGFLRQASGLRGAPKSYFPPLLRATCGHDSFGIFEDLPVPLARLLCCMHPQCGFNSKQQYCHIFGVRGTA